MPVATLPWQVETADVTAGSLGVTQVTVTLDVGLLSQLLPEVVVTFKTLPSKRVNPVILQVPPLPTVVVSKNPSIYKLTV